jgi:hypothetical protein
MSPFRPQSLTLPFFQFGFGIGTAGFRRGKA